ncbi:MAG: hypothetical protein ACKODH_17770 [Limisphaerales bacterium]
MPSESSSVLDRAVAALRQALGDNLCSCCLYGSAVRGNAIEGVSDLNVLIILHESTPAAHRALTSVLAAHPQLDPFILARRGFERSARAFATKFQSIRRNYRLLYGEDVLAGLKFEPQMERFLCEQALRNLRLRLVYAFVIRSDNKPYARFLVQQATPLMVQLSEALRLNGLEVPKEFAARIAVIERELQVDGAVLQDLLALKAKPRRLSEEETVAWHGRVFPLVDQALRWVETRWPA